MEARHGGLPGLHAAVVGLGVTLSQELAGQGHSNAGGNSTLHNCYPWYWQEHGLEMECRKLTARKRIERLPLDQTAIHNI